MKRYTKKAYTHRVTKLSNHKGDITSISLDSVVGLSQKGLVELVFDKGVNHMEFPYNRIKHKEVINDLPKRKKI